MTSLAGFIACARGIAVAYGPSAGSSAPSKLRYLPRGSGQLQVGRIDTRREFVADHLSSGGVSRTPQVNRMSRTGTPRQRAVDTPEAVQLKPTVRLTIFTSFLRSVRDQPESLLGPEYTLTSITPHSYWYLDDPEGPRGKLIHCELSRLGKEIGRVGIHREGMGFPVKLRHCGMIADEVQPGHRSVRCGIS